MRPARQDIVEPARHVLLEGRPALLTLPEYAEVMRQGARTVRRELARGACRVAPALVGPYRWARVDVEAYLSHVTITEDRRRRLRVAR